MQRTPWLERTFNFDFPTGLLPNILERLYGTECRIREMTKGLPDEILEKKQGNSWSIKEQAGHLADLESLHIGRIDDFEAGKEILRAADMTNAVTEKSSHNNKTMEELILDFSQKRKTLTSRLENLNKFIHHKTSRHPRLNVQVRPVDIAYFTAEHDDHHLASIRMILNANR